MAIRGAQEFTTVIDATPSQCFETVVDFESYPRWASAVRHIEVLERGDDGLARLVEFRIAISLMKFRYVLRYSYRKPSQAKWHAVEGDVESIEGDYSFRKLGAKQTDASCRQAVSIGFWVPGPIRTAIEQTALRDAVEEFKAEVERRFAAAPGPRRRG